MGCYVRLEYIDTKTIEGYRQFLAVKSMPIHRFQGRSAWFPDEYADKLGNETAKENQTGYKPLSCLFDYQRDIAELAIRKQKFAAFIDCGLGKTLIMSEFAKHAAKSIQRGQCALIISPLMVASQTIKEVKRFYGDTLPIEQVSAADLPEWLKSGKGRIGITNYEAITDSVEAGRLGALICDESSTLKSHYGKWGTRIIEMGKGLAWKLCLTGTPAPNDRIEYANHAVFLDQFPTVNAFLAKFFINRGQTSNRWEMKPHAVEQFYRSLASWSIFLTDPATYGWKDNAGGPPPIHTHIEDVELTAEQETIAGSLSTGLFGSVGGGIVNRGTMARIAKGSYKGAKVESLKPRYICDRIASWPGESTIVWCKYNDEQDELAKLIPNSGSIDGSTPIHERERIVSAFQAGEIKTIISKPKVMGFGLNLQIATRHVFSTLQDSFEEYYQAVKRSNRYGSTVPLNVHIPITELERPMVETVLKKAGRVQRDTLEQEKLFKEIGYVVK